VIVYSQNTPIGAVWSRLFIGKDKTRDDIDDKTPEMAIAVCYPATPSKTLGQRCSMRLWRSQRQPSQRSDLMFALTTPTALEIT